MFIYLEYSELHLIKLVICCKNNIEGCIEFQGSPMPEVLFLLFPFTVPHQYVCRRQWHPTPVLLPEKSHGWRNLVGCSPWGRKESDTTEWFHFHFSLACIGEGNGNPLQCSCLENLRDGGAWWAAVYGDAQSRTRLKRFGGGSSSTNTWNTVITRLGEIDTEMVLSQAFNRRGWPRKWVLRWREAYIHSPWGMGLGQWLWVS